MTRRTRAGRGQGQTLAEFALALPVFLVIILGLFDVGRAVFVYNAMTNAAREGARLAIVNQDEGLVAARAQAMAFGVEITTVPTDLVRYYRQSPNAADVESNDPCDNADPENPIATGCIAVVSTEASWRAITPVIGQLIGPITVRARSELPIEFVCPSASIPAFATADTCPKQP